MILKSAAELVADIGYNAVSMEAIAAKAGVGKQTLYRRWSNKSALFVACYETLVTPQMLSCRGHSLERDLTDIFTALFKIYTRSPAGAVLAGLVSDISSNTDAERAVKKALVIGRAKLVREPFTKAQERNELPRSFDVDFTIEIIVALVWKKLLADPADLKPAFAKQLAALPGQLSR